MTTFQKELISRGAMLLLGAPMVFGGVKSCQAGHRISTEYYGTHPERTYTRRDRSQRENTGAGLPNLVGASLLLFGGVLSIAALAGNKTREWLLQPTEPPGYE